MTVNGLEAVLQLLERESAGLGSGALSALCDFVSLLFGAVEASRPQSDTRGSSSLLEDDSDFGFLVRTEDAVGNTSGDAEAANDQIEADMQRVGRILPITRILSVSQMNLAIQGVNHPSAWKGRL